MSPTAWGACGGSGGWGRDFARAGGAWQEEEQAEQEQQTFHSGISFHKKHPVFG